MITRLFKVIALLLFSTGTAAAQTPADTTESRLAAIETRLSALESQLGFPTPGAAPAVADRLEALDQQIRIAARQRELDQTASEAASAASATVSASRDGFTLRSADNNFHLRLGGYVETDGRFFIGSRQQDASAFLLRYIRPVLQGTVFKNFDFRIMTDFGGGTAVVQEAYTDVRYWKHASLRIGKLKAPFGLERLQTEADLTFVDRGLPTALSPNRDEGVQVFGSFFNGRVNYAAAIMNGVVDGGINDNDSNNAKDGIARIFLQPFINKPAQHPLSGLGFGIAASRGRESGALPTFKTVTQSAFFSYTGGSIAAGERQRVGPQAYYYNGPFGLIAEYTASAQAIRRGSTEAYLANHAWQAAASYFLTGEAKSYGSISPQHSLDRSTQGRGAFELTARVSSLVVDGAAFELGLASSASSARSASEWIVGLNWYLNRNSRFVFDYEQTRFKGGAASGNRATERAVLSRFQVAF